MLSPQRTIDPQAREKGIRNLMIDAAAGTAIGALNSGVVLLALAIHIGASNVQIGFLAAIPLLTQVLQAPAVTLVERLRKRKLMSVLALFLARLALPAYALVPFVDNRDAAAALLLAAALLHYGLNAVGACSWNSWIRDLVPIDRLGQFSSRRGLYGTAVSAAAGVGAAFLLELARASESLRDQVFSGLYMLGFVLGLISIAALARVPEPVMAPPQGGAPLLRLLWQPLRDRNFRNVLRYLASWQFAVNLATPFFTVYFIRELGYGMGFVLLLTVASQIANIAVVRGWGQLSDRFTNKSVLAVATPIFLLCIAGVALAGELSGAGLSAYLVGLHVIMGAAGAGVGLASGNIVMKLSPSGSATAYMATNALVSALAAGVAPIVGGWAADFFARRRLELHIEWTSPSGVEQILGLGLTHWEFFFVLSALMGLYTLHRLSVVDEQGAVARREVVQHVFSTARRTLRNVSTVAGLRLAVSFPSGDIIKARERRRFLLENTFEREEATKQTSRAQATGILLGSAFKPPPRSDEFDALLADMDGQGGL